jgi:FtsZ-binding cell division protein ZapB
MEFTGIELGTFGAGLGAGLVVALTVWVGKLAVRSSLQTEIEGLKKHLHTQMSINAKGYEELQKEVETLKQQNENLRITVATLSNKPGRAELKTLHVWDKAIKTLVVTSPAFAPAWEMAIAEAKKEAEETDSGVKALVRRVFSVLPQDQLQP